MKKKILSLLVLVSFVAIVVTRVDMVKGFKNNIVLHNIEALANPDEGGGSGIREDCWQQVEQSYKEGITTYMKVKCSDCKRYWNVTYWNDGYFCYDR